MSLIKIKKQLLWCSLSLIGAASAPVYAGAEVSAATDLELFVQVSPENPHYFEISDGTPFIPIGLNLVGPGFYPNMSAEERMKLMESWMESLAENGGNFIRLWLGQDFWDIEASGAGVREEEKVRRIDHMFELARKHGIRMKLCMENFFKLDPVKAAVSKNRTIYKPAFHTSEGGQWNDLDDYLTSDTGKAHFRKKMQWYHEHFGDDPIVFAWELWNEMDSAGPIWMDWTPGMLESLQKTFPKNMVTQSLGSFDYEERRDRHRWLGELPANDFVQVHRYIDLGAGLEVCKGPMDILAADAVGEMRAFGIAKPILLAETGGVQPKHVGAFEYYETDKAGMILHDVLFAPFFAGAAGTGQIWHWGYYVDGNDLWYHFGRFAEAIKDVNPIAEAFVPTTIENPELRVYGLKGRKTSLLWCRDKSNTWENELEEGIAPQQIREAEIVVTSVLPSEAKVKVDVYDPWTDVWTELSISDGKIVLPEFTRSMVVRLSAL